MATPLKGNKLYPEIPDSLLLSGTKRKGGMGVTEKENLQREAVATKKQKLQPPVSTSTDTVASLQLAIERECLIRDGATKLLGLSKSAKHNMEASKGLFVSNMKILELMKKLQHVKEENTPDRTLPLPEGSDDEIRPCQARIGISDIRIPLEWKEFEQVKGKMDSSSKLGVFCLFRLGNQVMDTQTLVEVDRSMMDISFPDVVIFPERVGPDFTIKVEVYCSVPNEPHQAATPTSGSSLAGSSVKTSTPIKVLKKIRKDLSKDHLASPSHLSHSVSSVSLSPYVPRMPNATPTHNYALAGHSQFQLKDVTGYCNTYNLTVGAVGASGTAVSSSSSGDQPLLPLWGQICCKIMAEPSCATQPRCTGFINLQQMISGYPAWQRLWCVLRQQHLRCWNYPEDVGRKMPVKTIDLTKEMSVENAPRLTMRRPNTLLLKDHETDKEIYLSFESKDERDQWSTVLRQAIVDLKVWKDSTNYVIQTKASKYYENDFDVLPGFSSNVRGGSLAHQYTHTAETTVL